MYVRTRFLHVLSALIDLNQYLVHIKIKNEKF